VPPGASGMGWSCPATSDTWCAACGGQ
jgi:hypothetical protein